MRNAGLNQGKNLHHSPKNFVHLVCFCVYNMKESTCLLMLRESMRDAFQTSNRIKNVQSSKTKRTNSISKYWFTTKSQNKPFFQICMTQFRPAVGHGGVAAKLRARPLTQGVPVDGGWMGKWYKFSHHDFVASCGPFWVFIKFIYLYQFLYPFTTIRS